MYLPGVISRAETVAAGLSPRSEGVATARGDGVCGGEVVALPIPAVAVANRVCNDAQRTDVAVVGVLHVVSGSVVGEL